MEKLANYPKFKTSTSENHLKNLRKKINQRLSDKKDKKQVVVKIKTIVLPALYALLYVLSWLSHTHLGLYFFINLLLGFLAIIIFLNVVHELAHNNVFKHKGTNRLFLYFFDIMGANSFIWKKRHQLMHHNYPNVNGWDTDLEQSAMFKIFPKGDRTFFHRIQHYFIFLLYPLYLFNWIFVRDFRDFFSKKRIIKKMVKPSKSEMALMLIFKFFYVFYVFLIPYFFFNIPFGTLLTGYIIYVFTASITALLILLPPHANIENDLVELTETPQLPSTWLEHQLSTTSDVTTHNWFIANLMANFNFHIAHHLFPYLSYVDLPEVTEVIRQYAKNHNLKYKSFSLKDGLKNHYALIKKNASFDNFFEETM